MKITIKTTNQDYTRLLEALAACDYHWISGQIANEPPSLFKTVGNLHQVEKGKAVAGLRVINTATRLLGYFPLEVYNEKERMELLERAKDVDHAISFLQNHHHIHLESFLEPSRNPEGLEEFSEALRKEILQNFGIDIVELLDTEDENILYLKMHSDGEAKALLCKNMAELYQQYLGNTMSLPKFAELIGSRYQHLLTEVQKDIDRRMDDLTHDL